jgi:hypothetical protein
MVPAESTPLKHAEAAPIRPALFGAKQNGARLIMGHFNALPTWDAGGWRGSQARHPLPRRDRRHHALARDAHGLHHAHRDVRLVRPDPDADQGLVLRAPPPRGRDARRVLSLDLFLFYVFWELMLVPMYVMIGVWGGTNRIKQRDQVLPLHDVRQRS